MKLHIFMGIMILAVLTLTSCTEKQENLPKKNITEVQEVTLPATEETTLESNTESTMVKKWDKIAIHYTGTLEDGTKFDSSLDRGQPLEFTAGAGQMIAGFDAGVIGMKVGDKKTLTLAPTEAYGEYDETKKQVTARADLASFETAGFKLEIGEKIPTQFWTLKIVETDEENITLDLNHDLAGKTLIFDIELMEVKK